MVLMRLRTLLQRGRAGQDRPRVVLPEGALPAQPTRERTARSTSPSYVNLGAPLPAPVPRSAPHDQVVDQR